MRGSRLGAAFERDGNNFYLFIHHTITSKKKSFFLDHSPFKSKRIIHSLMLLQRGEGGHHQGDQCDQGAAKSPKSRAVAALRPCVLDIVQASSHSF